MNRRNVVFNFFFLNEEESGLHYYSFVIWRILFIFIYALGKRERSEFEDSFRGGGEKTFAMGKKC